MPPPLTVDAEQAYCVSFVLHLKNSSSTEHNASERSTLNDGNQNPTNVSTVDQEVIDRAADSSKVHDNFHLTLNLSQNILIYCIISQDFKFNRQKG